MYSESLSTSSEEALTVQKDKKDQKKIPKYPKGDIRNIIFERISSRFNKGIYANCIVAIMNDNGYINASKLCDEAIKKHGNFNGRRFKDWKEEDQLIDLVKYLSEEENIPVPKLIIKIKKAI